MRVLVTADLHYNHARSRALAEGVIAEMNAAGGDVLLVVGDTAAFDGDALERCLSRVRFAGPKLFVAGNHELWTHGPDSYALFTEAIPARIAALGWHWLEGEPFRAGDVAIVGTVGWYDYSFATQSLGIPRRFYERKISPGAAERFSEMADLFEPPDDIAPAGRQIVARWNDGKFVKLGRSDEAFLEERVQNLQRHLDAVKDAKQVVAAVHHVPMAELLPQAHQSRWAFARAFLGSGRLGETLLKFPNVSHVVCGHSHLPMEAKIGGVTAINIGSGYRWKTYRVVEV